MSFHDSNLTKTLKCLQRLHLVDTRNPNVIGLMTHAYLVGGMSGVRSADKWKSAYEKKKKSFQNSIYRYLEVHAEIVPIENDYEDLEKTGDWTLLPNGDKQPRNLFYACADRLDASEDRLGHSIINTCFTGASKFELAEGFQISAKNAKNDCLGEIEEEFHQFLKSSSEGLSKAFLVKEVNEYAERKNLNGDDISTIQKLASSLAKMGIDKKEDVKHLSTDIVKVHLRNKHLNEELSEIEKGFLADLNVEQKLWRDENTLVQVIGQGYNLIHDKPVHRKIFNFKSRPTNLGVLLPQNAKISNVSETHTYLEFYKDEEDIAKKRITDLGISMEVDYKAFKMGAKAGYNRQCSNKFQSTSSDFSVLFERRMMQILLTDYDGTKIDRQFVNEVNALPAKYDLENENCRDQFRHFFERWGHCIVQEAYAGGSVEMNISSSAFSSQSRDHDEIKAQLNTAVNSLFCNFGASFKGAGDTEHSGSVKNMLNQSTAKFVGGDPNLQSPTIFQDRSLTQKWSMSLYKYPAMLRNHVKLAPISDLLPIIDGITNGGSKSTVIHKALEDLLGGHFSAQKNREEEMKRKKKEDEIKREKERIEAATREEASKQAQPKAKESSCFSGNMDVTILKNGTERCIKMKALQISQMVKTYDFQSGKEKFSPVLTFLHQDDNAISDFLTLSLSTGHFLTVSSNHLLFTEKHGQSALASTVAVGTKLLMSNGSLVKVVKIEKTVEVGFYCPLTYEGTIIANNIVGSCYASVDGVNGHKFSHYAMLPLRVWKKIMPNKHNPERTTPRIHPYAEFLIHSGVGDYFTQTKI